MRWLSLSFLLLAGCATRSGCLPMREYTKEEQLAIAAAIQPLDPDFILVKVTQDYSALRAANRACFKG